MSRLETVEAWFEMCRTGDVSQVDELATSDYVTHGPGGTGDQTAFVSWLRWYPTTFVDQQVDLDDVIEAGDRLVVRYTVRSTYRGGYLELPPEDQPVTETGIIIFRFVDDRVAETWFEANDLQIAQRLGARISAP